ncbi:alpha-ketoacid dehydrogenase subunit beta [Streptomyces silvisoli]|uniref:Pyruvate dehydrogenase E1 component subunit beta n=1 Tax=Streptomyces silvisoli TaxID=3034235 RepID=A0ABT5ZKC2_9ACTN|nr:transketolase C-terminal domain-containing protein [Streptomyces silvisoli]MDF3290284.1 transketolase C-terminal domain-containing protein [Streptomyces silvisoli]
MPEHRTERVVSDLNRALHGLFDADDDVFLLGEDVADPYGGAFKVSRGLSERHPGRVISTPISEAALVGVAAGLALRGRKLIVEIMFSDFATLCFDQILNFASKSVTMYGKRIPMPIIIRCPSGGNRGYGPTHSQSLQKHFIGIPNLALFELSPFHDNRTVIERMLALGMPCMFFEDKLLYSRRSFGGEPGDSLFDLDFLDDGLNWARISLGVPEVDHLLITPGGVADRALSAIKSAFVEQETACQLVVPSQLYPIDIASLVPLLRNAGQIWVMEDGPAGGTWGAEVAHLIHAALWESLKGPVRLLHPECEVIPAASHLERHLLLQADDIRSALTGVVSA